MDLHIKPRVTLIAVRKPAHAAHDTQHVVVDSIDANLGGGGDGSGSQVDVQSRSVDTRQIASTGRLVLLRLQGKGVHVDARLGYILVMLVRLDQVEVATLATIKAIVTVQLNQTISHRVGAAGKGGGHVHRVGTTSGHTRHATSQVGGLGVGGVGTGVVHKGGAVRLVPVVTVVEGLGTEVGGVGGGVRGGKLVTLHDPNELLRGVIERHLHLVGGLRRGLITGVLQLLDQVLVSRLGEAAALVSVAVDVVNPQDGTVEGQVVAAVGAGGGEGVGAVRAVHVSGGGPVAQGGGVELDVELDLMVLQGDQRQTQTDVAAVVELEGDVQHGGRHGGGADGGLGQLGGHANHVGVTQALASSLSQLIPNVQPVTVVLIDALTTDLHLDVLDQGMTDVVRPLEGLARGNNHGRKSDLQVSLVDQITITGDGDSNLATEVSRSRHVLFNRFHGKISVTAVYDLEKSDLGVTGQINILSSKSDKLHKSTSHCSILFII